MKLTKKRLMENAGLISEDALSQAIAHGHIPSQQDKNVQALKGAIGALEPIAAGAIKDGYYDLTDYLPSLVDSLQKAVNNTQDRLSKAALQKELAIYKQIKQLFDQSALGTVL